MLEFPGYTLQEEIYIGPKTVVFRAIKESDNEFVILKTVQAEYPSITEISQLRYEYQISHSIDYSGIVRTHSLEIYKNNIGIVKEDFNAITLKEFFQANATSISCFLEIAIQLADILGHLHQKNIIHKDVNPSNILINTETTQVKITDFSIASRLQTETYQRSDYTLLEGTPAYISPEQTGRMNRALDYRTDLYSLGVTFYELLVGHLPFQTSDILELIHYHISEYPLPPDRSSSGVPTVLSDIVMKLMAKNAEERYQSALGLKADLEYCLSQLTSRDHIPLFTLGKLDHNSQFLIPQKLYGRATEVSRLLSAFARVSNGDTELMLVSGYSGIGKTSIVNEIHKPILQKRGFFVRGKFEQFQRNIPYFAFLQGFREFTKYLLSEPPEIIDSWRMKLLSTLGNNGQIIIDQIPEIELIIGSQPEVPELGTIEAQNRFNQIFQSFIRVFSQAEHPLVIFLDDLQWADFASLKFIERVLLNPNNHHLLLIGAYRDNEVNAIHPLAQLISSTNNKTTKATNIYLKPLQLNAVHQLVLETLHSDPDDSILLSELVYNKSGGNPFYLNQLLLALYHEKCIYFNYQEEKWVWNIQKIQSVKISDFSIIDLIIKSIEELPAETQRILRFAACIGNNFNLKTLSIISKKSMHDTARELWHALQKGLVLPLDKNYKIPLVSMSRKSEIEDNINYQFLHDRVQQSVYSLIPSEKRKRFHLNIGEILLNKRAEIEKYNDNDIFDIVNQMNFGIDLLISQSQRTQLAYLNQSAGKKAKHSAAYEAAKQYYDICLKLLPDTSWQDNYDYTINVYLSALELSYLNIDFECASSLLEKILSVANKQEDIVQAYEFQIPYYFTQNQPVKAISTALKALKMLGISLPYRPNEIDILIGILRVKIFQKNIKISDLANLRIMDDSRYLLAMRILMAVIPATFVANPKLFPVAISKMVELSLRYGNSQYSIFAYNSYGTLQCGPLQNFNAGYSYSILALDLLKKYNAVEFSAKAYMVFNVFNRLWIDHINKSVESLPTGITMGLEYGDLEYALHCASFCGIFNFLSGSTLDDVREKQKQYSEFLLANKQEFQLYHSNVWRQASENLANNKFITYKLKGSFFDAQKDLPLLLDSNNELCIVACYLASSMLAYIFNQFRSALMFANYTDSYISGVPGLIYIAIHYFYMSLSILYQYPNLEKETQKPLLKKVKKIINKLEFWSKSCPENFFHKYQLVKAEYSRVLLKYPEAMDLYDLAISAAAKSGYVQEEAIANERAAEFYFEIGRDKVAQVYLSDAYYGYAKWGAIAKVRQLEEQYPAIFSRLQKSSHAISSIQTTESSSTTTGLIDLDLASVLKASQAISEEIILDQLLEKLMQVLMQSAGAQAIFLILDRSHHFVIEASATKDSKSIRQSIPVASSAQVPCSIINYVARTLEPVFLGTATTSNFSNDPYIQLHQIKSLLCLPMINQGHLMGMVYLENNLAYDAFRGDHLEVLRLLCAQAAISLENAYLYEDLQQSQAREQAEREINELKSRFISMTSHEFRTPLTAILGTTELIKHYGQGWDTNKQHTYLDRIQKNVKHMTGLLDDVLVLSKADVNKVEFNPKLINLKVFCSSLVEEFQLNTKRDQQIEFDVFGNQHEVYSDEKILRQILSNLLSNAIKYSPESTSVRFQVNVNEEEVTFFIKDQGIGIPEADQQHLFESFHRATNVGQIQGTGLGLAIVKKSVELHRGTIDFESIADKGTTFIVKLPITTEALGLETH
ncbi:ATP-binding sensor histidine kinase [Acaryochloris sp. CCMEE 5410]|uniref:ATP-binding sensor histidine kinase n=1 Tax=Acaryochloris sp. CCMEE 5410 TaxID=310037 RepID=UPI00024843A7|nr:ATP-binding sensor histidine kinase [Acaryochloris sp. CCMEE 5410]KAI9131352.1 AAA family ATPase [Acaryochloris sp. CCMEE 5410]